MFESPTAKKVNHQFLPSRLDSTKQAVHLMNNFDCAVLSFLCCEPLKYWTLLIEASPCKMKIRSNKTETRCWVLGNCSLFYHLFEGEGIFSFTISQLWDLASCAPVDQGLWKNSTVVGGSLHQVVMNNIRTSVARCALLGRWPLDHFEREFCHNQKGYNVCYISTQLISHKLQEQNWHMTHDLLHIIALKVLKSFWWNDFKKFDIWRELCGLVIGILS